MEFISVEEFLKQDENVQKVFLDWWTPSVGDICAYKMGRNIDDYYLWQMTCITCEYDIKGIMYDIPLLSEGQLRKFIEDKTGSKILKVFLNEFEIETKILKRYCIHLTNFRIFMNESDDVLQAYWKVAIQIAEQL
ncbi:MAG: hypothetical protein KIC67_14825 [Clostridium butyricum]|nr:hypothetical protein [Clostridium butyricum]